jgi:ADP-ribose pyrophosphatase
MPKGSSSKPPQSSKRQKQASSKRASPEGVLQKAAGKAKVLDTKIVFPGKVFSVREDRVIEPGGVEVTRDIVVHRGSVVVLPIFPDGDLLLIRQYRHAVGDFMWELVAGRVEEGESRAASARRELIEETGYTAKQVKEMLEIVPSPGFCSERMWIFAATGLREGAAQPEEDERITARKFSLGELEEMIRRGKLRDGKSVSAILYYARFLK